MSNLKQKYTVQLRNRFACSYAYPKHWSSIGKKNTGKQLPLCLRRGMEAVSGLNLKQVRVHYNSELPALVQAHAYAQGEDIYLAPGQEHHLPHELGHIVQQALGMVKPTTVVNGIPVNDDEQLEQHATEIGEHALKLGC